MTGAREKISDEQKHKADIEIRQKQQDIKYDVRDFTVDYLVSQFKEGLFFIPPYQREFIWRKKDQAVFIESVLLGLPIPMLFVADLDDGRLEVVDGAQRLRALVAFLEGDMTLSELTYLATVNGFKFSDLPDPHQRKLKTRALRVVVLADVTSERIRQEIFHRINKRGEKARGSEIRRGSFKGPFMDFVRELAQDRQFRKLCPIGPQMILRREDEELVTRFFAYSDEYKHFKHDVDGFVDDFVSRHQVNFERDRMLKEFHSTMAFVERHFPNGFAKGKSARSTPRVRFESIAVGTNLALRCLPNLVPTTAPSEWLESPEFLAETTTHASNSGPRLRSRINFVRDKLLGSSSR